MAGNTEEIAIKLGVSNYEFVTAVRDAEAEVDKLKKAGKTASEENGLLKSFDEAKHGFRQLKEVIEGAGMLKLLGEFFNGAIEYAKNYKGATDANIEAVKKFGEGYENLKVGFMGAGAQILGSVNRIGTAMGDAVKYWAAAATGSTKAWMENENALEASEKSLQSTLKLIQDQSKYAEQNKKIGQEMAALREKDKEYDLKKLTDLEQVNALENRIAAIKEKQASGQLSRFESNKAELELMKNEYALREKSDALYAKTVADQRKANEEQRAANLEKLTSADKQRVISQEIADIQNILNARVLSASDTEYYTAQVKARQLELTKAQVEEHKLMVDLGLKEAATYAKDLDSKREELSLQEKKRSLLSEQVALKKLIEASDKTSKEYAFYMARDEQIKTELKKTQKDLGSNDVEIAKLLLKGAENLTDVEKEKLKLLKGETTEVKNQQELHILTMKLMNGTLLPAEKARLMVLTGQTAEIKAQNDLLEQQLKIKSSITGAAYDAQSNRSLEAVVKNLKDQIQRQGNVSQDPLSAALGNINYNPMLEISKAELAKAQAELDLRNRVQSLMNQYGSEDEAYKHWMGTVADFERGVQYSSATSKDSSTLQSLASSAAQINDRLKNGAGLSTISGGG